MSTSLTICLETFRIHLEPIIQTGTCKKIREIKNSIKILFLEDKNRNMAFIIFRIIIIIPRICLGYEINSLFCFCYNRNILVGLFSKHLQIYCFLELIGVLYLFISFILSEMDGQRKQIIANLAYIICKTLVVYLDMA